LAFTAVSRGIGEILHPFFVEFGIQPTYLVNNVVLENDESIGVFRGLNGQFELGTHLHGDFIDPGKVHADYAGKDGLMNQCFLEPEIEYDKLKNITTLFTSRFGYSPLSFRAGRFSAGTNTIRSLAKLGYKVDTSVTPRIVWNDPTREIPVDFTGAPDQPYWTDEKKFPQASADKSLLEIPVSIVSKRRYLFLKRPLWLRPYYSGTKGMIEVCRRIGQNNPEKSIVVLNMMFHNIEIMPNLSPYSRSNKDVMMYLDSMKGFFEFCLKSNIQPATLSGIYNHYSR
jgi:hypothetical protein